MCAVCAHHYGQQCSLVAARKKAVRLRPLYTISRPRPSLFLPFPALVVTSMCVCAVLTGSPCARRLLSKPGSTDPRASSRPPGAKSQGLTAKG